MRFRPSRLSRRTISSARRKASTGRGASASPIFPCGMMRGETRPVAGKRMSTSQRLGESEPRGEAEAGEVLCHVGEQRASAAKEMRYA